MEKKKLPKERPEQPETIIDNQLIVQINKELSLIRAVLQRSLKDEQQAKPQPIRKPKIVERVSEKLKQTVEKVKSTLGTAKDEQKTGVKKVASDVLSSVPALGSVGIGAALVFSESFRETVWNTLKETFDLKDGILPKPLQEFIKLFTDDKTLEKTKSVQEDFTSAGDLAEKSKDEFSDENELQNRSDEIKTAAEKAAVSIEKGRKEIEGSEKKPELEQPAKASKAPELAQPGRREQPAQPAPTESLPPTPPAATKPTPSATQSTATDQPTPFSGVEKVIVDALVESGIQSPKAHANILATVKAESNFKPQSENLNYLSASQIQNTFGKRRFPTLEFAEQFVKNPVALGNEAYKTTDGNSELGDGYKYRGRGFIQHTGKNQYAAISKFTGIDLLGNPDALNDVSIASKAIAWFFLSYKRLKPSDLESMSRVNSAVGFADQTGEKAAQRESSAAQIYATLEKQTPTAGTQLAAASEQVVGAQKEEKAKKNVATNTTLVATNETTVIQPRRGSLRSLQVAAV